MALRLNNTGGQAPSAVSIHLPRRLEFGAGCATGCADWIDSQQAASTLFVTAPPTRHLCEPLLAQVREQGREAALWDGISQEPVAADLDAALEAARDCRAGAVVAVGGGSAMDVAKLVAALLDGGQSLGSAFGIGNLAQRATPLACLPTTSGTGSEVSPIAIVEDPADGLKKGVISPHLVPDAAFVDPLLTLGMPPAVTAATGIDALTHCIEAYTSRRAHPLVDAWALEGIRLISRSLARAVEQGDDLAARSEVAQGSLFGGLCLGPVNTAAVHALAYPLGSSFGVAHGVSNAVLLPHVMAFNLQAAPARHATIARALGVTTAGDDNAVALEGIERVRELIRRCRIPAGIAALGVPEHALPGMAEAAMTVQRLLSQNPREVSQQDALQIYQQAY